MSGPRLSALVVARNEEAQLARCLEPLRFADELVVVLDRSTDGSRAIAERFGARVLEGAWEIEGPRRNAGIALCTGDWILEVDADERVTPELAKEIRARIATAPPGHFLIPIDNYVGDRLVRHGWGAAWGTSATVRLFSRGMKSWGDQRIHPRTKLGGVRQTLSQPMAHYVDKNISDMIRRLDRYTTARAADMRATGQIGTTPDNVRRFFSRFYKCYVGRKGYKEGGYGVLLALMAGLYPLLSHLKAKLEKE
ncbi:MAG: glycosyltransferase family 2 protein [Alphaproteobacteria bacterium]